MAGPLAGLRVLELATGVAGPYCGKLYAGLGADVIKVEPPAGDSSRYGGPFPNDVPDPARSGLFLHLNTGKRSFASQIWPSLSDAAVGSLLADTDVLLLSQRPEELQAAGVDLPGLLKRYPRLVVTSVTPFGLTGPYANYRGGELICYALGGYMMLTGAPDREPIKSYGDLVQYQAGGQAALGTLAALFARERTGRGQLVDVSAMESATYLLGGVEQQAYFYGRVARRNGTRLLGFPPEHSYPSTIRPCADGYVHCHSNNRHPDLLAALIPDPQLLDPALLKTPMGHADQIDAIMDSWLADKTRVEIVQAAQELRLPFTEVMEPGEVMHDPHHKVRGSFVEVDQPAVGKLSQPGAPFRFSATPWETRPSPGPLMPGPAPAWHPRTAMTPSAGRSTGENDRPLAGYRIIDFTNAVAGPMATSLLGVLGAEVVKVESPAARPRNAAGTAPLREGCEDVSYDRIMLYNNLNHSKRAAALDVARPAGREVFLKLVAKADAVVQNFSPRVMRNLHLDYSVLSSVNPGVILTSMPAFGLSGPYQDRGSYGPGVDAMSGLCHLTGYEDGPPMKPGNFFCDQNAAVLSAFATMAALWARERRAGGQHVELAMIEGEFQILGDAYIDFEMNGRERRRQGNLHAQMEPHGVFPSQGDDQWVAIAAENDDQWVALATAINRPDLATESALATLEGRREHRASIAAAISSWTREKTHLEAQDALQAAGVPAGAVLDTGELLRNDHVVARHGFEYVEVPNVGPAPYPRPAFLLSGTPVPLVTPAPGFAADNDYVLKTLSGLSDADIAQLEAEGVTSHVPRGASH
jgi:crotonobetainyl-CoA:carnitine CoA-transferase CaiB-like acyl-CoA transferase